MKGKDSMQYGYSKAVFIAVIGFSYIGVTFAVTDYFQYQNETKRPVSFNECFWKESREYDFLSMTDAERENVVVKILKSCNVQFNK